MRILITGVSGYLAQIVARQLLVKKHEVVGIDHRPWLDAPPNLRLENLDIRKRPTADLFRQFRPHAVVHMATETYVYAPREERYRLNLKGTQAIWKNAADVNVKHAIFVGRHTVYGAASDAPLYRQETEPLLAGTTFPSMADLVAADLFVAQSLWRTPRTKTAILRMVYPLGPVRRGTLANYLSGRRIPSVLGFDPLFQVMHTEDAASAVVAAIESKLRGVFNVAGPAPIPLSEMIRGTGGHQIAIPEFALPSLFGRMGLSRLPKASLAHLKYPVVIDDRSFRTQTDFNHQYDIGSILEDFRRGSL